MAKEKKQPGLNPELESAISKLLRDVMNNGEASLTDKTKVIDRALKLEQIRLKIPDEEYGSGLFGASEDE